jgi:hypothetical protein
MSDTNTDDPVLLHLRERKRDLEIYAAETAARLAEIDGLITTLGDGRTRVRRRLREVPPQLAIPDPPETEVA